ncbi:DUF6520 family protein [Chitinophaga niabensis]|uniref:DUF6520 family protein n=1 Tax=Chitinophaga niabensis TaxID=536979 RepID=UPI00116149F9|nr:DUF6520 family protein [Chitinophaga niabensis]
MKKRLFLSAVTFIMAIGGAFASTYLFPQIGYSRIQDVNEPGGEQQHLCVPREECDGGIFVCTADFQEGSVFYVGIQLYGLDIPGNPTDCNIQLTRSIP